MKITASLIFSLCHGFPLQLLLMTYSSSRFCIYYYFVVLFNKIRVTALSKSFLIFVPVLSSASISLNPNAILHICRCQGQCDRGMFVHYPIISSPINLG